MNFMLRFCRWIDRLLNFVADVGGWCIVILILCVCYDVLTRYFGVPKILGLTSTKLQEAEYWLHSYGIVLCVGYGYIRQSHVRIDLLRDKLSERAKYILEATGCLIMLIPYSILGVWLSFPYVLRSWSINEASRSGSGLSEVWILKSGLIFLFVLMGLAGISVFIKALAGLSGKLPQHMQEETIGG